MAKHPGKSSWPKRGEWGEQTYVEWVDSCSYRRSSTWLQHDDVYEMTPTTCHTVGWLLKEDAECIVLVSSVHGASVSGDICIPKVAIKRRWIMLAPDGSEPIGDESDDDEKADKPTVKKKSK